MENNTENMAGAPQKSNGALVGSIIIVIILILGGIYLLKNSVRQPVEPTNDLAAEDQNLAEVEGELDSMDLENLDSDI
jgi:hypothetical protein